MVLNSYILYKKNTGIPCLSWLAFPQSIIEDLAQDHLLSHGQILPNRTQNHARVHVRIRKIAYGKEKDCRVCSDRNGWNGRKRTRAVCTSCGKGLHKQCKHNHVCMED